LLPAIAILSYINTSRVSAATLFRRGGIYNNHVKIIIGYTVLLYVTR